jgi:protein phosphatase 2C family protein 2/3
LSETCESICEYCLAPDTAAGAGIGCDNMTVMIVAILHGRTLDEWYVWMKDRYENKHGYSTPEVAPTLYSALRLRNFRARRESYENRMAAKRAQDAEMGKSGGTESNSMSHNDDHEGQKSIFDENSLAGLLSLSGLTGLTRVLGSTGGISFQPGAGIRSDNGELMFGFTDHDNDDDSDLEDEDGPLSQYSTRTFGGKKVEESDSTQSLREKLEELERDIKEDEMMEAGSTDQEGDTVMGSEPSAIQGEAPPPPPPAVNGVVSQLKSEPHPDSPLKEGDLLDKSEDPSKLSQ